MGPCGNGHCVALQESRIVSDTFLWVQMGTLRIDVGLLIDRSFVWLIIVIIIIVPTASVKQLQSTRRMPVSSDFTQKFDWSRMSRGWVTLSAISLTRQCPQCREIAASVVLNRKNPSHCSHCAVHLQWSLLNPRLRLLEPQDPRFFNVYTLEELFDTVSAHDVFGFITNVGLYRLAYKLIFMSTHHHNLLFLWTVWNGAASVVL